MHLTALRRGAPGHAMRDWLVERLRTGMAFSFTYDGVPSAACLQAWARSRETAVLEDGSTQETAVWTDGNTCLSVVCTTTLLADSPAVEWLVGFRNGGQSATPIIRDVRDMDLTLAQPLAGGTFVLHRLNGAPANVTDFEPRTVVMRPGATELMGGGSGRSSNKDFPV